MNNDGKVDVAWVYNDDTSSVAWVYLNDGNANFTAVAGATLPTFVDNYVFGDFNRDGKTDLAARIGSTLYEYSGDGAGHFTQHATSSVRSGIGNLAVGSFNHDGILDIAQVVTNCDNNACDGSKPASVYVYLGDGAGHFGLRSSYSAGAGFGSITAGELNGDGVQDILVMSNDLVNGSAVPVQELLNTGDGHFTGPYSMGSYAQQSLPLVRDLNLDGRHDLVLPAGSSYVLLNQNAGVGCAPPSAAVLQTRICGPANDAAVAKTFTVKGSGNSPLGVVRMELWVDGKKSYELWNDQLSRTITVSAARHRISVVSVDRFGKYVSKAIYVQAQ